MGLEWQKAGVGEAMVGRTKANDKWSTNSSDVTVLLSAEFWKGKTKEEEVDSHSKPKGWLVVKRQAMEN